MAHSLNTKKSLRLVARTLSALALAFTIGTAVTTPASADPYHGHDYHRPPVHRGWDDHARDNWAWHRAHPVYAPGYVVAPPVVYAPPPQPAGLSLILPINIR